MSFKVNTSVSVDVPMSFRDELRELYDTLEDVGQEEVMEDVLRAILEDLDVTYKYGVTVNYY